MSIHAIKRRKPVALVAAALLVAATLAACGGSETHTFTPPGGGGGGGQPDQVDAFFAAVQAQLALTSETSEPIDIGGLTATSNEDKEATPI